MSVTICNRLKRILTGSFFVLALGAASEEKILYHTQESPYLKIDNQIVLGEDAGNVIRIEINRLANGTNSALKVSVAINDFDHQIYSIGLNLIPSIDINSAMFFSDVKANRKVIVEMRFSEERDCFVNDDGRDRLVVIFEGSRSPVGYKIGYADCEPEVEVLQKG